MEAQQQQYSFYYRLTDVEEWEVLVENADGRLLSTDRAGGFTGTYIGMYASTQVDLNSVDSIDQFHYEIKNSSFVDFDWFDYKGDWVLTECYSSGKHLKLTIYQDNIQTVAVS